MAKEEKNQLDYGKLGFKCGIELHQQLETHKLFCSCPSIVHDKDHSIKVVRKLRAVAGELEKVDRAAAEEVRKGRHYIYEASPTSCCLVELDEEPPHNPNPEAIQIAFQIASLLNAKIVDEIQFMRKTVVDGSNVSGFQRTALIAYDGYVETSIGKVSIENIYLEEEAAQRAREDKDSVTFRLDRLGVALVEIQTGPDIKDAEHAKETSEKIGMIMRSTGKVKRGIGTVRQDVNVSIKGHPRVEIKGFQNLKTMPRIVENEVKRQLNELKAKVNVEPHVRKAEPDLQTSFLRAMPGAARMYPETDIAIIIPKAGKMEKVELISEKIDKLEKKYKLGKDMATKLGKSDKAGFAMKLCDKFKNVKPAFVAETLISYTPELLRNYKGTDPLLIKDSHLEEIFQALDSGKVAKKAVMDILVDISSGKGLHLEKYSMMSDAELDKELKEVIKENSGAPFNALIGRAMGKLKGKADGKKVVELLKKLTS
jgi:Glu-tRNA(Gln) amidotransferase subunit E-like FAD-binding protein